MRAYLCLCNTCERRTLIISVTGDVQKSIWCWVSVWFHVDRVLGGHLQQPGLQLCGRWLFIQAAQVCDHGPGDKSSSHGGAWKDHRFTCAINVRWQDALAGSSNVNAHAKTGVMSELILRIGGRNGDGAGDPRRARQACIFANVSSWNHERQASVYTVGNYTVENLLVFEIVERKSLNRQVDHSPKLLVSLPLDNKVVASPADAFQYPV